MRKRISRKPKDPNQTAAAAVEAATSEEPQIDSKTLSRVMAEMGRKGGRIGGKRSLQTMSATERKKRAQRAAAARWKKKRIKN